MLDVKRFGERLAQARKNAGLTTLGVASVLYTDASVITRYEKAEHYPNICRVVELAELYGCSIDWLCGMDGGKVNEG